MLERTILSNLLFSKEYSGTVLPYLKPEYFADDHFQIVYKLVQDHFHKYKTPPTNQTLLIDLENKKLNENIFKRSSDLITELKDEPQEIEWLLNTTESFCRSRAIRLALYESVNLYQKNEDNPNDLGIIPDLLSKALNVSFEQSIGHNLLDDAALRHDFYHQAKDQVPFDIEFLNQITSGGLPTRTMMVLLGGTGAGKSMTMGHIGASYLVQGKNVLYISLEMSDMAVSERIDMNLLNLTSTELRELTKEQYLARINELRGRYHGQFITEQFPSASAHSGNFRRLLLDLEKKKGFKPDLLIIDYINICASARLKSGASNTYEYVKAVTEELRGLAVEFNTRLLTATQVNRDGFGSSDIDMTNTSDSFGIPFTADYMVAIWATEEMKALMQMAFKQLKNRYGDVNNPAKAIVGVNMAKMKLYDLSTNANAMEQSSYQSTGSDELRNTINQFEVPASDISKKIEGLFK